jgi:predicted MFS family arabinose efflux permease
MMGSPLTLFLALFVVGVFFSTMDVAMNAQAVAVEQRAEKPLMSSFHASFSVGGLAGALAGALHGASWIPARWYDNIENGDRGRDEIVSLARRLAALA